jgi:membrane fusion protein (multidrug efflux system)
MTPMPKKLLWALVGVLIALPIAAGLIGTKIFQFQAMADAGAGFVMPPEPVNGTEVREARWQPRISAVGSVTAVQGTVVSTEAEGVVRAINFEPGTLVKAGEVLVQLDVDVEQAQLHAAEVDAEWARISYRRAQELSKSRNISQAELDAAATSVKQAEAQVNYIRALIARKTVRAPFAGELGIRSISVGQFLGKGSPVVSLQALDPVYVEFSIPQQRLGELAEGLVVAVASDAYPEQAFEGLITAVNPQIDPETRNVRVQATLANADGHLRPGMFVSLDVALARSESVLLIPATAVQPGPHGDSLFVIEEDSSGSAEPGSLTVRQQFVRLGARRGDYVVVTEGVKAGEKVVSTGVFKLRPGMAVVIDNSLAPEFSLAPTPKNT